MQGPRFKSPVFSHPFISVLYIAGYFTEEYCTWKMEGERLWVRSMCSICSRVEIWRALGFYIDGYYIYGV